jgi:hypothetical protein
MELAGWLFNWKQELSEPEHQVYKLVINAQGLIDKYF